MKKKRGVSPVIATVLLISIVVILALIIFLWARSFVGEKLQKFDSAIEYSCGGSEGVKMEAGVFSDNEGGYDLEVINRGNVPIYGFVVKELGKGTVIVKDIPESMGSVNIGESRTIKLNDVSTNEILVVPILLGRAGSQRQAYTCGDEFGYAVSVA